MSNLEQKIEAILFFKGEPVSLKRLGEILKISPGELIESITRLKENLKDRGITLQENNNELTLGTIPELSELIENLQKEELNKDLSKASLETLSIILYKGSAHRAYIDYVRGVNSSFTLRALSIRGLIEKTIDPEDNRRYLYKPTFELLSYLGIKSLEELPEYAQISINLKEANENMKNMEELENESA
ncbi:hypothetical protein A3A95_03405 [Candidatus Nomurabacteria bacterium RIFCSPLOWO2_01_FULL_39_18]|nr:MAG: hypothetical protein A3A95_03405 [Candidatus Nomurabacteria bacterium RIFCSPLOWO2_01_FULL_39_18]